MLYHATTYPIMKYLCLILCTCFAATAFATDFYVSNEGNDQRAGNSPAQAWQTLEKVQASASQLAPGDRILFRRGDVFYGQLHLKGLNGSEQQPISLGAYGTGDLPVLDGAITLTDWKKDKGRIWKTTCKACMPKAVRGVYFDAALIHKARYPNLDEANSGYLIEDKGHGFHDQSVIIDHELPKNTKDNQFQGAEVVARTREWLLDVVTVQSHTGNTIKLSNKLTYGILKDFGYFFQNSYEALDQDKEWYFDAKTQELYIFLANTDPNQHTVEVANTNIVFSLTNSQYVQVENLVFRKGHEQTVSFDQLSHCSFSGNQILLSAKDALVVTKSQSLRIEDNLIDQTQNNGLDLQADQCMIQNNTIRNTATVAGMGASGNGQYIACFMRGADNTFRYNQVISTGYNAVHFNEGPWMIENNFIDHFNIVKNDGAGIYCYKNTTKSKIRNNIILHSEGADAGTPPSITAKDKGIYVDEGSQNMLYEGNTIAYCGEGLLVHAASHLNIINNTFFDNRTFGIRISQRDGLEKQEYEIKELNITGNTLYTATEDYPLIQVWVENRNIDEAKLLQQNNMIKTLTASSVQSAQAYVYARSATGAEMSSDVVTPAGTAPIDINHQRYTVTDTLSKNMIVNPEMNERYGPGNWSPDPNKSSNFKIGLEKGMIDGQTLKIFFSGNAPDKVGKAVQKKLSLQKDAYYAASFEAMSNSNKPFNFQVITGSKGTDVHTINYFNTTTKPKRYEVIFKAKSTTDNARMIFEITDSNKILYIDNVQLHQVAVKEADLSAVAKLEYNASQQSKKLPVSNDYINADGKAINGSITLPPYGAAVLLKKP